MYDHNELAFTGLGTITIGGIVFDSVWLAAGGLALIMVGLILVRVATPAKDIS